MSRNTRVARTRTGTERDARDIHASISPGTHQKHRRANAQSPVLTARDPSRPLRSNPAQRASVRGVEPPPRRGVVTRYGIAVALTIVALGLTIVLKPYMERSIFLMFWPAVIAAAWLGGFGPAMLTAAAAVLLADYFFVGPIGSFGPVDAAELITLAAFMSAAGLTSWAVSQLDRAREAATLAATENARLARLLDEQSIELSEQLDESPAMQEELEQSAEELAERTGQGENAERFSRGILESISDPFVVQDSDWRFRYINAAAARVFSDSEYSPQDLIGKVVWEVFPGLQGSKFEKAMRRARETKTASSFEAFTPEQGHWSELFCYPLPDGGLGTQWKDITERKRAEEASGYLHRATELLASSADYETSTVGEGSAFELTLKKADKNS